MQDVEFETSLPGFISSASGPWLSREAEERVLGKEVSELVKTLSLTLDVWVCILNNIESDKEIIHFHDGIVDRLHS